jgi:hypothetical protein
MMNVTIVGRMGEYDVEVTVSIEDFNQMAGVVAEAAKEGLTPRPRFQNNAAKVELPFTGVIDHTELVPAKDGKKEHCLAHVKHTDGSIVPVRYWPPQKTWKAGESVNVQKGQYGPELKEIEAEDVPF